MKIKKSHLKELIRKSIAEIDFKDEKAFKKYKAKHKMRGSTKVKIAGKDTTVDKASGKKEKEKMVRNAAGDMVPASKVAGHPDFKKDDKPDPGERDDSVRKDQKGGFNDTQDFITGKNAESNIEKLNNLAMDDNPVQFDTDKGQSLTWDDGDYDSDVVYAIDQDGGEVVVPFDDIVRLDMDIPRADRSNAALFSDPEPPTDDVGGPAHPNVPKGAKSSKDIGKTPQPSDFDGDMDKYLDALNKHMKDVESKIKKGKNESIKESKGRRFTVKEVRTWMKKLEENRYKKVYNSDARRVSWMVNNEGVELTEMPKSMRKKWTKAQYGRERYLAKEFLKSKNTENKLRESIQKILTRLI